MSDSEQKLEGFAIVEVMGHGKFAGRISEHKLGPVVMIRIDVPPVNGLPEFTKFIAPAALFGITPVDEETARTAAEEFRSVPIYLYSAAPRLPSPHQYDGDEDPDFGSSDEVA